MKSHCTLNAGDLVEVRSKEEILGTLDSQGRLDGLPFMPEMFAFCGKQFRVFKRAHKTCDTINSERVDKGRTMKEAVHLEGVRCNGAAHGGCHALCLVFWKEAWLKPVAATAKPAAAPSNTSGCTEADVQKATCVTNSLNGEEVSYACQATQLVGATTPLPWWNYSQYWEDYRSGNVGIGRLISGFIYSGYFTAVQAGIGLGKPLRWIYDRFQALIGGVPYPRKTGLIPADQPTPTGALNLQPGELVRVKSYDEILATLNTANRNRGLYFDAEMVPYCGGTFRVLKRVERIIDEKTGRMQAMKNPCIVLDGAICQARYSWCRMFCPRAIYAYWREIWLERLPEPVKTEKPAPRADKTMAAVH